MAVNNQYLYSDLTDRVISAAFKVHKELGPGLVEKLYQRALAIEFESERLKAARETKLGLKYKRKEYRLG